MKEFLKRVTDVMKIVFGYGIMICLFGGGLTFFGYLAAFIVGGEVAEAICVFIYKTVIPVLIRTSTVCVLLGLLSMYLSGETALTATKKKAATQKKDA